MGFFSRLFRDRSTKNEAAQPEPAPAEQAVRLTFDLDDALFCHVTSHDSPDGKLALWSFVSEGLRAHDHPELVFTVLRRRGEAVDAFPKQILVLLRRIQAYARDGHRMQHGGLTELGNDFLAPTWRGVVYAAAQALPGIDIPANALVGIAVDLDEIAVIKAAGAHRVLARLGRRYSQFPFPPWIDRDRPSVAKHGDNKSLVNRVGGQVQLGKVSFVLKDQRLAMLVPRDLAAELAAVFDELPTDRGIVMLPSPARGATGWFAWEPGQDQPFAITAPAASAILVTGGFLAVAITDTDHGDLVMMLEDGFSFVIRPATWLTLKQAIATGQPFALPAGPSSALSFELMWTDHASDEHDPARQRRGTPPPN